MRTAAEHLMFDIHRKYATEPPELDGPTWLPSWLGGGDGGAAVSQRARCEALRARCLRDLDAKLDAAAVAAARDAPRSGLYRHADGSLEEVRVVKQHSDAEGGGLTVFLPSLGRERSTVPDRVTLPAEAAVAAAAALVPQLLEAERAALGTLEQAVRGLYRELCPEWPARDAAAARAQGFVDKVDRVTALYVGNAAKPVFEAAGVDHAAALAAAEATAAEAAAALAAAPTPAVEQDAGAAAAAAAAATTTEAAAAAAAAAAAVAPAEAAVPATAAAAAAPSAEPAAGQGCE